jgi:tetratricopeptide (TPR) repeat protein
MGPRLLLSLVVLAYTATLRAQSSDLSAGVAAVNAGDAEQAVRLLERAVAAQPSSRLALLHLANAHMGAWPDGTRDELTRHAEAAAEALQRALGNDERDALARWNLAMTYGRLGRLDQSIGELQRLLTLEPSYPEGARTLGTLLALSALEEMRRLKRELKISGGSGWMADPQIRERIAAATERSIDEALGWLERGRAQDNRSADAVAMTNFALRLRAQITPDEETANRYLAQADAFVQQAATLRRQSLQQPAPGALDPNVPPPPFSAPGAPPPPPPG